METKHGNFIISDDQSLINVEATHQLILNTYWANNRTKETMQKIIENSLCFGVFKEDGSQVGFARCVTDYTVMYWVGDVVINDSCRGQGLGKALMNFIVEHENIKGLKGFLTTKDAFGLYEQFGFYMDQGAMRK